MSRDIIGFSRNRLDDTEVLLLDHVTATEDDNA